VQRNETLPVITPSIAVYSTRSLLARPVSHHRLRIDVASRKRNLL
jgi:hypothetical protein